MIRKSQKFLSSRLKRRRKKFVARTILYVVFAASLILGLSSLSRAEFLSIKEIKIDGIEALSEEKIKAIVEQEANKSFLKIFSRSNIFLYPRKSIESEILKSYKRVSEVDVSLKGFSGLEVFIKERKPFGLWCKTGGSIKETDAETKVDEECFYLDETGYVFEAVEEGGDDDQNFTKYLSSDIKTGDIPGGYVLSIEDFQKLNDFSILLGTLAIYPKKVFLNYPEAQLVFEEDFKLIIDLNDDIKKTFENLVTLISEPEFQTEESFSFVFEYIDLSFGNKILYKLR